MNLARAAFILTPFFVVSLAAAADAPPTPTAAAPDPSKAEGRFKNIQSFKGYPADDVFPAMQFMSAALGVDCEFCHVERAMEKDDKKEKQTARKMIAMTSAINRDSFDGHREVTCVSCHRGSPRPSAIPAIGAPPAPEEAEVRPEDLPVPAAILDAYVKALGGPDAMAKVSSRVQKGKLTGFGPDPVPIDVTCKAPTKRLIVVHSPHGENTTAFDGQGGWLGSSGRPARDMSAAESDAARIDNVLFFGSDPKSLFKEFKPAPPDKIDGKDVVHLRGLNDGKPPADLWFDKETGLLTRLVRYAETPLGRLPTRVDFADFRDAGGAKIPFRWTIARPSGSFTIQLDESNQNVPVDDKAFQKPSPGSPS